jgi:hypothetical protein
MQEELEYSIPVEPGLKRDTGLSDQKFHFNLMARTFPLFLKTELPMLLNGTKNEE